MSDLRPDVSSGISWNEVYKWFNTEAKSARAKCASLSKCVAALDELAAKAEEIYVSSHAPKRNLRDAIQEITEIDTGLIRHEVNGDPVLGARAKAERDQYSTGLEKLNRLITQRKRYHRERYIQEASSASIARPNEVTTRNTDFGSATESYLGNPIFENPFTNKEDPRYWILAPYFEHLNDFLVLAEEYPELSMEWRADSAKWLSWPLPQRFVGAARGLPTAPGADLHVRASADEAVEHLLLRAAGKSLDEALKLCIDPGRDRWLNANALQRWEVWLYAIREFWLKAGEEVDAAGADSNAFEKVAEASGYVLMGSPRAIGKRVWNLMLTQRKSLNEVIKEHQLSIGDEIRDGEAEGWIQNGQINYFFRACAYSCAVLASRHARGLSLSAGADNSVGDASVYPGVAANQGQSDPTAAPAPKSAASPSDATPSLEALLNEAQKQPDAKLRRMLEAVIRYNWYLKELRPLKVASKKYQTPDLLKKQFASFEVWDALDRDDINDIAAGNFDPGRFSWALVRRLNNLKGKDDRTLKNYRKALRDAGIAVPR